MRKKREKNYRLLGLNPYSRIGYFLKDMDSKTKNVFRKRKDMVLANDIETQKRENIIY